mmetsp:Transcript_148344/g.476343  ORF Transcript_148344/g.476343 Transcript_148344/m.476343 type:complete len:177 (-) Transcript_148344:946-1476(-)
MLDGAAPSEPDPFPCTAIQVSDLAFVNEDGASAKPQWIRRGEHWEKVWPEHWGITLAQCRELMQRCRNDPAWKSSNNVYTLVNDFIKPLTAGTGLGYALLVNQKTPLEVSVMVSHAWLENAEEFFETFERSVREDDVMFICALSLYQCEEIGRQPIRCSRPASARASTRSRWQGSY